MKPAHIVNAELAANGRSKCPMNSVRREGRRNFTRRQNRTLIRRFDLWEGDRNRGFEHGSVEIRLDFKIPAKGREPLPCVGQADADIPSFQKRSRTSRGTPVPKSCIFSTTTERSAVTDTFTARLLEC